MSLLLDPHDHTSRLQVRLDTLVRLRWLAVVGQAAAVLIVAQGLQFPLPTLWCFGLIALSVWLNLFLKIRYPSSLRLTEGWTSALLAYDIAQLGGLLFLTGGLTNPFALLLIAPVTVSAAALPPRSTVFLAVLSFITICLLAFFHFPLPWPEGIPFEFPRLLIVGNWLALALGFAFTAIYTFRIADEGRQLAEALAATELVLEREQHLSALDGLAAATAHELGTPLATIVLTAKEVRRELPDDHELAEDIALIASQASRCREILSRLSSLSADPSDHIGRMPLSQLLEEVVAPHRDFDTEITIEIVDEEGAEPIGQRNPGILYGLGNIVENAVDFARRKVMIKAYWNESEVKISVSDDGPGFAPGVLDRLGDPYVTTRSRQSEAEQSTGGGLGLGLFIAKTLLERSGARVTWRNRPGQQTGAVAEIVWPRAAMERTKTSWDTRTR
ncbi:MAG: two-component sensor histidine kinase [Hyphomicrobiales bacterium]|nr:MAG: two-component sensor histidine kinase [Hyphomicrobiales bacterium]